MKNWLFRWDYFTSGKLRGGAKNSHRAWEEGNCNYDHREMDIMSKTEPHMYMYICIGCRRVWLTIYLSILSEIATTGPQGSVIDKNGQWTESAIARFVISYIIANVNATYCIVLAFLFGLQL